MSKVLKVDNDIYDKVRKKSEKEEVTLKEAIKGLVTVTKPDKNPVTSDEERVTAGKPKKSKARKKAEKAKSTSMSNSNWLLFIIIAVIFAVVGLIVAKRIKGEGGGGQKVESPKPQSPSPTPAIPEGREWTT